MADFIDALFVSGAGEFWRAQIPIIVFFIAMAIFARFIGPFIKTPKRPDPDPLADVEFEENGAVKMRDE